MHRWAEWIQQHFNKTTQENENVQIDCIQETTWGQIEQNQSDIEQISIPTRLQHLRNSSNLQRWQNQHPKITQMLIQDYAQQEIIQSIKSIKNNKAHGEDSIPAESYKAIKNWIAEPIAHMLNEIKNAKELPKNGKMGQSYTYTKIKGVRKTVQTTDPYAYCK